MKWIFTFLSLIISGLVIAQTEDSYTISTDRPSVSFSASSVPQGTIQAEIGYTYLKQDNHTQQSTLPNLALRFGLIKGVELRLITDFNFLKIKNESNKLKTNGFAPIVLGIKTELFQAKGLIPKTSLLGQASLPKIASQDFKQDGTNIVARLLFEHDLGKDFGLFYNLGSDISNSNTNWAYTLGLCKSIGNTGVYVEGFGNLVTEDGKNPLGIDAGLSHTIKGKFQFDMAGGLGLNAAAPKWFGTLGFSFYLD